MPDARAAAAPPEEPPGVFFGFHGLRVMPVSGLSVTPFQPNSGVVVLPSRTAPCSRSRATAGASSFQGCAGSIVREPRSVGQPFVTSRSLIETGTPSRSPFGSPFSHLFSDSFALFIEDVESRKQNAFSTGFSFSILSRTAFVTSTGEMLFLEKRRTNSVAESEHRSFFMRAVQVLDGFRT